MQYTIEKIQCKRKKLDYKRKYKKHSEYKKREIGPVKDPVEKPLWMKVDHIAKHKIAKKKKWVEIYNTDPHTLSVFYRLRIKSLMFRSKFYKQYPGHLTQDIVTKLKKQIKIARRKKRGLK